MGGHGEHSADHLPDHPDQDSQRDEEPTEPRAAAGLHRSPALDEGMIAPVHDDHGNRASTSIQPTSAN